MNTSSKSFKNVRTYISKQPAKIQKKLKEIRLVILKVAPEVVESIAYGMPAYKLNGKPIAYFAVFEKHIGFYATPNSHKQFSEELVKYKQGKGSVQFPITEPLPLVLIAKMVKFNVEKNQKGVFSNISAPAQRALFNAKITNLAQLTQRSEVEIANLHGMGPKAVGILKARLKKEGLAFKK